MRGTRHRARPAHCDRQDVVAPHRGLRVNPAHCRLRRYACVRCLTTAPTRRGGSNLLGIVPRRSSAAIRRDRGASEIPRTRQFHCGRVRLLRTARKIDFPFDGKSSASRRVSTGISSTFGLAAEKCAGPPVCSLRLEIFDSTTGC